MTELATQRLRLRQWHEADADPWAALNADAEVMAHFVSPLSRAEADAFRHRQAEALRRRGWGVWAVEVVDEAPFIGAVGLAEVGFEEAFTPAVEVMWRLDAGHWGKGYATEAALAALAHAFDSRGFDEVVSFTTTTNAPSEAVMRRIGMTPHPAGPFDHPNLARGHRLRRHVLYRITAESWAERTTTDPA